MALLKSIDPVQSPGKKDTRMTGPAETSPNGRWKKYIRHVLIYILIIVLPLVFIRVLHAGIPVYPLIIVMTIKLVLEDLAGLDIRRGVKLSFRIISTAFSLLFAIVILVSIVITPSSVYLFFFEVVGKTAEDEYFIADLFVLAISFFSMSFGSACIKHNSLIPMLCLFSIISGLLVIIYQSVVFVIGVFVFLLAFVLLFLKKQAMFIIKTFIPCIILGLIFYAVWSQPQGSIVVDTIIFPETRKLVDTYFPQFPLLVDIPGYGIAFSTNRLGGRAFLTSAPVFEVQGNLKETVYLKTNSFDIYTHNSWQQSVGIVRDITPNTVKESLPWHDSDVIFSIKILTEVFPLVPYTIDTYGFEYKNDYYAITGIDHWPGIEFKNGFRRNSIITLYRNKKEVLPENPGLFLRLPENLSDAIENIGTILGQNASSGREILSQIKDFLAVNYRYNLDVTGVGENEDFLENFLFKEKQGYCTHFATAFVILARINRIPARYATGYLVNIGEDSFSEGEFFEKDGSFIRTVTARTAHAWPEVWLPEKGWHIWEPTQAVNLDYYARYFNSIYDYLDQYIFSGNEIARNSLTLHQLRDILGIDLKFEKEEKMNLKWLENIIPVFLSVLLITAGICVTGGLLFLLIRIINNRRKGNHWKMLLNRIVKVYKQAPLPEEKGWIHWKHEVRALYKIEHEKVDRVLSIILKLVYSNKSVTGEEILLLKQFTRPGV